MKFLSWNVNGIRAAAAKGFRDWFEREKADFVCLQEVKAFPGQVPPELVHPTGYRSWWAPAQKPGYSGVATFAREEPLHTHTGFAGRFLPSTQTELDAEFDAEGRVLTLEYDRFVLINSYFPNSQREKARLDYKLRFCDRMLQYCKGWEGSGKQVVLCGDYNIAHEEIDLKNPKSNHDNAGFLPEERAWMTRFLGEGFRDVFREANPGAGGHYTWWSYRPGIRARNIGWRLDYHCVSSSLVERVKKVGHQPTVQGSDHCPTLLELKL